MSRIPGNFDEQEDFLEAGDSASEIETLERTILAACNYVVPSDDLRPRTLDKARELSYAKANTSKIGFAAVVGFSVWAGMVLLIGLSSGAHERLASPFGREMQVIATKLSLRNQDGVHWALVDAFMGYRKIHSIGNHTVGTGLRDADSVGDLSKFR